MADILHHAAIEVSIHKPLSYLRQIAADASPDADHLLMAQRDLLRRTAARLRNKGLSTDTETYRRLGILIPPWRHPDLFEETLAVLQDYWRRHRTATTLGRAAPYRQVREKAAKYLRLLAEFADADDADNVENNIDDNDDATRFAHLLPSTTAVRVFRLVNGNLEVPPTLFKALSTAGRIEDVFFPDEPAIWQMALGGVDDDAENDIVDNDEDVLQVQPEAAAAAGNYMYQAVQQFMQQMTAGSPRNAGMPPLVILPMPGFMPSPMPGVHPFMSGRRSTPENPSA